MLCTSCSFSPPALFSSLLRSSNQGMFCHKIVYVDDAHSATKQQRHEQSHFFCPSAMRSVSCLRLIPSIFNRQTVAVCYVCVRVFSSHSFWTSSSLDVPAGVTQEEGHTGFLIHLLSAVRAFIFLARRIQPFLSLVDREVEFCVLITI